MNISSSPRLRASLWVTRRFCSAVRKRLVHVQCRTDSVRSPAAGIVVLKVKDLPACIAELKKAAVHFRNEMETGPGGRQIQIEDPDGNLIELFEPAQRS